MSEEEPEPIDRAVHAGTPAQLVELQRGLRALRLAAGQPSLRLIAQKTGWSRATVGRVFTGKAAPKWDALSAVVGHLGGDTEEFRALWMSCMNHAAPEPPGPDPLAEDTPACPVAKKPEQRKLAASVAVASAALLLLVTSAQGLAPGSTAQNQAITDAAQFVFGALAAGAWYLVFFKTKARRALVLGTGLAGWSLGQAYWLAMRDVFDHPIPEAPSLGDLSYLLLPACALPGLVSALPRSARLPWALALVVLLASTTAAAVLALLMSSDGKAGAAVVYSLYVVTDLEMVAFFSWLGRQERSLSLAAAASGTGALLLADALFCYFAWWRPVPYIPYGADTGYVVFPLAMIVAASLAMEGR